MVPSWNTGRKKNAQLQTGMCMLQAVSYWWLHAQGNQLSQLQAQHVVAYGRSKKRDITGIISRNALVVSSGISFARQYIW